VGDNHGPAGGDFADQSKSKPNSTAAKNCPTKEDCAAGAFTEKLFERTTGNIFLRSYATFVFSALSSFEIELVLAHALARRLVRELRDRVHLADIDGEDL
jgi:hypothetical protein